LVENTLDLVTGTVTIPAVVPDELLDRDLKAFFADPNDDAWGRLLCRTLFHETIHFWQVLSSGYLADIVASEWGRAVEYIRDGNMIPREKHVLDHRERIGGAPFSALEMVESLARFWDVHTRSAVKIIEEEGIEVPDNKVLSRVDDGYERPAYTNEAFDLVMYEGRDCQNYAAPYRWMLERVDGDSAFVVLVFPILAYFSLCSPRPVEMYMRAFDRAYDSPSVGSAMNQRNGIINLDWFSLWRPLMEDVVQPTMLEMGFPRLWTGFDVIPTNNLSSHPIYPEYIAMRDVLYSVPNSIKEENKKKLESIPHPLLMRELEMAMMDPTIMFALPGQPDYRMLLGRNVPPPTIRFENVTFHTGRPGAAMDEERRRKTEEPEPSFKGRTETVNMVMRCFREAEYAVSLGLPPDHFEKMQGT